MKLTGKVAIITGAGRGLGRASAIAMAREGAAVVVISRTASEVRDTAATIEAAGGRAVPFPGDVSSRDFILKAVLVTLERFGRIDILMNNAAVIGPLEPLWLVEPEEWQKCMSINLSAPQMLCREVVPQMVKQKQGKIINVTSGLGVKVMPPFGTYSVSKAGLNHLTRIVAEELKVHNIQVNALSPGVMDTRMQDEIRQAGPKQLGEDVYSRFRRLKERGELVPAEQMAVLTVFLASAESDGITGEIGDVDRYVSLGFRGFGAR